MSEVINNHTQRQEILKGVIRDLHAGKAVEEVKGRFATLLQEVGAGEIAEIEQALIAEGLPEMEVKRLCDVHVAVFRDSLDAQAPPETIPGHPIHTFRAENEAAARVLDGVGEAVSALQSDPGRSNLDRARARLQALRKYEAHYLRKENILFPYLERHGFSGPSSVMWAIHDDVRAGWKELGRLLEAGPGDDRAAFGARVAGVWHPLETAIREMFYKEANILFPTALEKLEPEEWRAIYAQEVEIGFSYVERGEAWPPEPGELRVAPLPAEAQAAPGDLLTLDTGALTAQTVNQLLAHLPLEVSYVDADDTVRFFSHADERIFPRSPAIIGRKVQKCHPPASVHRVQRILDEFWIQMQGRFVHIRYVAIRDEQGEYQGTLETVQDVTQIRALEGERRLLDEGG
jgi:DUF438 domain-containing protein